MKPTRVTRAFLALAALSGLLGVALSARASHGGDGPQLAIAAQFLLMHAPVILGLAIARHVGLIPLRLGLVGAIVLATGLALFTGDLTMRAIAGRPLFPFAAPFGGALLMLGWLGLLVSALLPARNVG